VSGDGTPAMAGAAADVLLVRGGFLYAGDADNTIHPKGSLLAVDGRIVAVGEALDVEVALGRLRAEEPSASLRTLDARGSMILPGFVNPHWHDMLAMTVAFRGALRPFHDHGDEPGFLARGGDMPRISSLFDRFCGLVDELTATEADAIAAYSMWTQLRAGSTTLGDVGSLNRPAALLSAARRLGLRAAVSTWAGDLVCDRSSDRPRRTRDADRLLAEIEGVFAACAKDPTGRTRARPSAVYMTNVSDELGAGLADVVARYDSTFTTHVGAQRHESKFVTDYFGTTPLRRLDALGLLTDRLMAVHCAFADHEEADLLISAGVHINHSPAKYGPSGESTLTETGLIGRLRAAGLDVSLSTDGTTFPLGGMAENMRAAWQMHNEMHADHTFLPPTAALAMATRIAAKGLHWEEEVGSLEVGKRADLLLVPTSDWRYLLNPRPLEAFLVAGGSADIDTVVVEGRTVVEHGAATLVDEAELRTDYLAALRSFSARIPGVDRGQLDSVITTAERTIR
jgi:cytosine/adenosine deaminase-related metal-dependent hydrolase